MKKKPMIYLLITLVVILTSTFVGCSKTDDEIKEDSEIKTGVYATTDGLSYLTINETDKSFVFQRGVTSYRPFGSYDIDGDKLLLNVDEDIIKFEINGDRLIFESGELAQDLIKRGTEFIFTNESLKDKTENNLITETAEKYGITHENYPKIDGSTSTLGLVETINSAMYKSDLNNNYPREASKTVPSYKRLINGEVDLIIVPSASLDVLNLAKEAGVELEFEPVVLEALIFITPVDNETKNITRDQVREIYLNYGIKNWSELGGPDKELVPICRNADSGSQSQMDNLILENKKIHPDIDENFVELTMEGLLEQVAFYHEGGLDGNPTESYGLGYTLYTYLKNVGYITGIDENLKILEFEGVLPSEETIGDGSYSLTDGYYAVVRSDLPQDHGGRKVIKWLKSQDGKDNIRKLKLIPKE